MQLGIFAKTFEGTHPEKVLSAAVLSGFSATQYNLACSGLPSMPDFIDPSVAREVASAAARMRIDLVAVSGTYNMIHPDIETRNLGHRRLDVLGAACADLGTGLITLCTGTRDPDDQWRDHPDNNTPEAWRDLLRAMETAIEIADRYDVNLGIEPELANVVNSATKARKLIDELQSPRLKIVLDPANLFEVASLEEQRTIVSIAIDLLADRIAMAHAKDRKANGEFTTAGSGVLDYGHYLKALTSVGFDASLVAHGLKASEAEQVASFLKQALAKQAGESA